MTVARTRRQELRIVRDRLHRPELNARQREWNKEHPESIRETKRKYRAKNPEVIRERHRRWRKSVRGDVFAHYGNACVCCGESNPAFLTIDHINNDGMFNYKKGIMPRGGNPLYRWIIRNNFPHIFRILCWNCNSARYHNGGICPHEEEAKKLDAILISGGGC